MQKFFNKIVLNFNLKLSIFIFTGNFDQFFIKQHFEIA